MATAIKKFTIDAASIQLDSWKSQDGDKPITRFMVTDSDGNEFKASAFGDRKQQVEAEAAKGAIAVRVVPDLKAERDNTDVVASSREYKGQVEWNFKFPFVKGNYGGGVGGGGFGGGNKFQGRGGYSGGGGGSNRYNGKPLSYDAFITFCGDVLAGAAGQVAKTFPGLTTAEVAETAQKLTSTYLISIKDGLAYPPNCEPAAPAATPVATQGSPIAAPVKTEVPQVDLSVPGVAEYVGQIMPISRLTHDDPEGTLDAIDGDLNVNNGKLPARQVIALRQMIIKQRKSLDL